jgi:hypothetical protein
MKKNNAHGYKKTRSKIEKKYPQLVSTLLDDLLKIEGYCEVGVAFISDVDLALIRKILACDISNISSQVFLKILLLYARVFCNWNLLKDEPLI